MKLHPGLYFDSRKPDVSWIKSYCKDFIDLNRETRVYRDTVVDAVFEASNLPGVGVIIPSDFEFWDNGKKFKPRYVKEVEIPLNSPLRFKKYGPQIDLEKKNIAYIKEHGFKEIFAETLNDEKVRKRLKNTSTRGLGYFGPRTGFHHIIPWGSMVESEYYYEIFCGNGDKIRVSIRPSGRISALVPSYGSPSRNRIIFETPPVTQRNNVYRVEALETRGRCSCPDVEFKEEGGKIKLDKYTKFERFTKYRDMEIVECRHIRSAERKLCEDEAFKDILFGELRIAPKEKLTKFWLALTVKTLIGTRKSSERPIKTYIDILTGNAVGSEPLGELYYL